MSKIKFGLERTTPATIGIGMSQTRMGELMPPVKRLVQATQAVIVKVKSQPSHVGQLPCSMVHKRAKTQMKVKTRGPAAAR